MKFRLPLVLALALVCVVAGGSVTLASNQHLPTSLPFGWHFFPSSRLSSPVVVTSDSLSFCLELAHLVDSYSATKPSASVSNLKTEGMTLCENGHVRPGLVRLRRALLNAKGAPS
ncbi:hypothetical protein GOB86_07290 [Acetobacter lambici]|uniref:Uncharacterized protein n=1 Tax=Acetobacter lambici TaxID=1332824 RepID=A0ABT1F0A2_9PROT|nr:hypothetical protein [Acetobacter lambici]MCP1242388.1 hypothetical protein [Acetobacter lambici]MCP1258610.1 hypothetical protein [Acetobacter lambici]NHO56869.1 hypothetical protein [Acetobacter lambici]